MTFLHCTTGLPLHSTDIHPEHGNGDDCWNVTTHSQHDAAIRPKTNLYTEANTKFEFSL
jgi:hypothetical protein